MSAREVTQAEVDAAARRMWRDAHGRISSHDHNRTPESDEAEMDESGYGDWDRGRISGAVMNGYRRRSRAALEAAAAVRADERDALRALIDSEVARAEGAEFAQLRAERDDLRKRLDQITRWFVETLHYPFDFQFDPAPPIDHRALAEHWRISDGWSDMPPEDALACVLDEAGIDAATLDELEEGQG